MRWLILLFPFALQAAEVSSVRDSQYDWTCETETGELVSGHTRQDKAFQACFNAALTDGLTYYVRGGQWRVSASLDAPPVDPDPIPPDPPPDPPPEPPPVVDPLVTFGPVSAITVYPETIAALAQDRFTWLVRFTVNTTTGRVGLVSRDESGTLDPGHLSLWVENGSLLFRHQDACPNCGGSGEEIKYEHPGIETGREYVAEIAMSKGVYTALWLDDELVFSDPRAWGLASNNLPLVVGGLCSSCKADGSVGPQNPIDGSVFMAIYDEAKPLPTGSVVLNWINPTENTDGTLIEQLLSTKLFLSNPLREVAEVQAETTEFEVVGLMPGQQYCFVARAVSSDGESDNSNEVCKVN